MSESTDLPASLEQKLEAIPERADWMRVYALDSFMGLPTAQVMPCAACGALMLYERTSVRTHCEWHERLGQ